MLHWVTVLQRLELREAHVPAWDPDSRSGLATMWGPRPWWAWHLLAPQVLLSMWGARARDQST